MISADSAFCSKGLVLHRVAERQPAWILMHGRMGQDAGGVSPPTRCADVGGQKIRARFGKCAREWRAASSASSLAPLFLPHEQRE